MDGLATSSRRKAIKKEEKMETIDKDEITRLEKRIKQLEDKQEELEIELRRLRSRLDSRNSFEEDRDDYLEILNDTHGYYDY